MSRVTLMPNTAYKLTLAEISDYPRKVADLAILKANIGIGAVNQDGMPKGNDVHSNVEEAAIRIADMEAKVNAIDKCINSMPSDMRQGVLNNIWYRTSFPYIPELRTWQRVKRRFIKCVAKELGIYDTEK